MDELQLPNTPEVTKEQEEEDLYYDGEDKGDSYQASTFSGSLDTQWQDLDADSPEEGVESYPSRPSLPDDIGLYNQVVQRAALTYKVKLEEKPQAGMLLPTQTSTRFLPMLQGVQDQGREAFKEPAVCRSITPRCKKYKHSSQDPTYIRGSVPPDSIIASTAR